MEPRDLSPDDFGDELHDEPVPAPDALARHKGKVIAFDARGEILEAADTWAEIMRRLGSRAADLTLMYVPAGALIG